MTLYQKIQCNFFFN